MSSRADFKCAYVTSLAAFNSCTVHDSLSALKDGLPQQQPVIGHDSLSLDVAPATANPHASFNSLCLMIERSCMPAVMCRQTGLLSDEHLAESLNHALCGRNFVKSCQQRYKAAANLKAQ